MQRRGGSEWPAKGQRTSRPKSRKAPTALVSGADLQGQLEQRTRELDEALQQQTATGEVLGIIRRSPADAQPVFDAIVESATRLCGAIFSVVYLYDGDHLRIAATKNFTPDATSRIQEIQDLKRPERSHLAGRAILDRAIVHVHDVLADPEYSRELALAGGWRAVLSVPLLREGKPVGALSVAKVEPVPFSDRQIQLLKTFADQAVIAIENVRLFEAEQARTRELSESLEQQTATSEVLKVISSSPGELEPVFNAMLANATRICEATFGGLFLYEAPLFRTVAIDSKQSYDDYLRRNPLIDLRENPGTPLDRVANSKQVVHIPDLRTDQSYIGKNRFIVRLVEAVGARTFVSVPMLKEGELIGAINMYRQEVRPFTDKQIELVSNFAAQAVIAIENARLLHELRESLQQQTATSEVLKVISSSPGELKPVFNATLENATRICDAKFGILWLYDGEVFRLGAWHNVPSALADFHQQRGAFRPTSGSPLHRLLQTRDLIHSADELLEPTPGAAAKYGGARSLIAVPMRKENELVGAFIIYRQEVRPFTDKQIELVKNFAAQAVIAIENTRLLNELRESLQQQTATADVLKVISSSPGELQPVFNAMLENATRICAAEFGTLYLRETDSFRAVAIHNAPPEYVRARKGQQVRPPADSALGQVAATHKVAQIDDITKIKSYVEGNSYAVSAAKLGGYRTIAAVPMLKDYELVGAILIYRQEVRLFSEKQIALLQNFAAQAVIAIENARLLNELRESLQQQTATADVLKVISSSPGQLEPVFGAMLENAVRICGAKFGMLHLSEGDGFRTVATHDVPRAFAEKRAREPFFLSPAGSPMGRVKRTRQVAHIADITTEQGYVEDRSLRDLAELGGARTVAAAPMLKDDKLIGAIVIYRQESQPFTDKQIELVQNFAAQAVIAIENTRLLTELRESLQQQTATADVLKVISRSTFDLQTVLDTLVESAARLCGAEMANIWRPKDGAYRLTASYGVTARYKEYLENKEFLNTVAIEPGRGTMVGRVLLEGKTVHMHDIQADPDYKLSGLVALGGYRTMLGVPLLRQGDPIGVLVLVQSAVRPFTDKQIELATTFADQAVIAIENVRLFDEVQARTRELSETLEQQTATADVLKVISSSLNDLRPVFETIGHRAEKLCDAEISVISMVDGDQIRLVSINGVSEEGVEAVRRVYPMRRDDETLTARAIRSCTVCHVPDVLTDPLYQSKDAARVSGFRAGLAVPMIREGQVIGAIFVSRKQAGLFPDAQVQLLKTFADQAVIAIENVRLFNETKDALAQQTATADVLKLISRSAFDLRMVLQTLIESAARFCDADQAIVLREKAGAFYRTEAYGFSREFMDYFKDIPIQADRGSASGRALLEGRVVHIPDVTADPEYTMIAAQRLGDYRTILCVPMMREGVPIGVLVLTRSEVRPFTDKQIELVTTFADQAAIAIENVRLFESVEARTRELAKSLEDLRTTQDRLVQTQKLASLGQLTAGIAHEIKNPLNFVNNFSGVSVELIDELRQALDAANLDSKLRAEISEIADTLQGNLDKVVQHGKRADSIVKNMLLHSREGSGEHRVVDINALVEESLNLAYHGARAEKQGFNITMERSLDPAAGQADVFPQDVTRVLLNLISNGFYAATRRKAQAGNDGYEPTLAASTKSLGDRVEIRIRDNGTGIPPEVKEKMFNPFFTTKPAGEGTGLGLSICHDIIVKQHGGSIEVDTEPGEFTEIRVILPRAAALFPERS
jgi:GAF domain-containing protein